MVRRATVHSALIALSLLANGCGDDDRPPAMPLTDAGPITDGGPTQDARAQDGDLPDMDGEVPGDDAGTGGGCGRVGDVIPVDTDPTGGALDVAAAGGPTRFAIVWSATRGGRQAVLSRVVEPSGALGEERQISSKAALIARDPAVVRNGDGWAVAWAESTTGVLSSFEVWVRPIANDGSLAAPTRMTNDAVQDVEPAITSVSDGLLVAWTRRDKASEVDNTVVAQRLSTTGTPMGTPSLVATVDPARLALSSFATTYQVAWTALGESDDVWMRRLSSSAMPSGSAMQASMEGNAFGSVGVAGSEAGGVVVFDVASSGTRRDIRARVFAADRGPIGGERVLSTGGIPGQNPAVVPFAGGYAAVWRAGTLAVRHMRLALLAPEGDPELQVQLAPLRDPEGNTGIGVTSEGTLLVIWSDHENGGASVVRVAIASCG